MGGYSIELCGGCHLKNTSEAGLSKIVSEGGVAAGVRRIEAVTGEGILKYIDEKNAIITESAAALKTTEGELVHRCENVMEEIREQQRRIDVISEKIAHASANNVMAGVKHIGGLEVFITQMDGSTVDAMRKLGDAIKEKTQLCVCVFAALTDGKITFMATAGKDAVKKGVHCGKIIKEITAIAGGSGGGKPDSAQGGGKNAGKIDNALAAVDEIISAQTNA